MSDTTTNPEHDQPPPNLTARRWAVIGVAVVIVGALLIFWAVSGGDSDADDTSSSTPTASSVVSESDAVTSGSGTTLAPSSGSVTDAGSTSSAASEPAPVPTTSPPPDTTGPVATAPVVAPTTVPPVEVSLDDPADLGSGVDVAITNIEKVDGEAQGVGERDGPSLRLTVELTNGTDADISTNLALVNLYYGSDLTPATSLSGPGVEMFPSTAKAGETVVGKLVFLVPEDQRDQIVVEFTYDIEAPKAIFTGSVE